MVLQAYIVSRSCLPFFETEGYMYRQLLVSIVTALAVKSDQSSQNSGIILIANLLWNLFLRCLASKQQAKKFVGIVPTLRTILLVGDLVITTEIMNLIIDLLTNRVGDTLARNAYASQLLEKLLQYLPLHQIVKCGDSCKQLVEKLVHNSLGTIESVESGDTNRRSPTVYRLADAICILIAVASTEKLSKADSNSNSSAMTSLVGLFIRNACVGTYVVKVITNLSKIIPVLFKNYFEEYLRQNSCEIASRISVDLSRCLNLLILTNCMSDLLQAHEIPKSVQSLLLLAGNNIVDLLNDSIKLSDKLIVGCKADSHVNTTFAKSMDNYVVLATCLTATISRFSFNVIVLVGGAKYLLNSNEVRT